MKTKVYLRVAHDKHRRHTAVKATRTASPLALTNLAGEPLATVAFAIVLDIPDAMFERAAQVIAELRIPEEAAQIVAEVHQ